MAGRLLLSAVQSASRFAILWPSSKTEAFGDPKGIRLPDNLKPLAYDLAIRTDLIDKQFWGAEVITIETVKRTESIVLHAGCNLELDLVRVHRASDQCWNLEPADYERDCKARTVTINMDGRHVFEIEDVFDLVVRWSSEITSGPEVSQAGDTYSSVATI